MTSSSNFDSRPNSSDNSGGEFLSTRSSFGATQKRGDEALAELVTTTFWVAPKDERVERNFLPDLSLELERNSNFNELVMAGYGCELRWRRTTVTWMAVALLRCYIGDESMIDSLRCYSDMYFYRLGGG